jgi:hypothetical protein
MSEALKGRISPRLGTKNSEEHNEKWRRSIEVYNASDESTAFRVRISDRNSKPISIDGVIYKNVRIASEALGIHHRCIGSRLLSKNPLYKTYFKLDEPKA